MGLLAKVIRCDRLILLLFVSWFVRWFGVMGRTGRTGRGVFWKM